MKSLLHTCRKMRQSPLWRSQPLRWLLVLLAVMLTAGVASFSYEVHTAKRAVEKYIGIWEDDIARTKIFQGDPTLQNKILKQLSEVNTSVGATDVQNTESLKCLFSSSVPVTYNTLPVGAMKVCYKNSELLIKAMTSPLMMLAVLLGTLFMGLGLRREFALMLKEEKLKSELALNKEIAEISRQVAHDIRGPLMALTTLSKLSHEMGSDKKELLQLAVSRIQGIAEDLLTKGKTTVVTETSTEINPARPLLETKLVPLTESLLKEFRFSYPQVQFSWHNHLSSSEISVTLGEIKIQRILSNLLSNSLEAMPEQEGSINVTLMERADHILMQIMDNGSGIPEEILPRLMTEGFSYGKSQGNGLGLYDAQKTLNSIGGDLQIRSRMGVGTQVILLFPKDSEEALASLANERAL